MIAEVLLWTKVEVIEYSAEISESLELMNDDEYYGCDGIEVSSFVTVAV